MQTSPAFNRLNVFSESFNPDNILHRDKQKEEIAKVFANFHGNLLLSGNSGTGKTSTIKYIMKQNLGKALYFCPEGKTSAIKLIKNLSRLKTTKYNVINSFVEYLINNPRVLIIDEVDKVFDLSALFNFLNFIYRQTNVPILIISTDQNILKKMPDDAFKTLFFQRISFGAYDALELRNILEDRLKMLNGTNVFGKETLNEAMGRICALATQQGSARNALFMLHECLVSERFDEKFINSVVEKIEREDWEIWYLGLNPTQKKIVNTLAELQLNSDGLRIRSSQLPKLTGIKQTAISTIITKFEDSNGAITSEYENLGRKGGRIRYVKLDPDLLKVTEEYKRYNK